MTGWPPELVERVDLAISDWQQVAPPVRPPLAEAVLDALGLREERRVPLGPVLVRSDGSTDPPGQRRFVTDWA